MSKLSTRQWLIGIAVVFLASTLQAQQPGGDIADDGEFRLKIFRLKHRDPDAVAAIAGLLLSDFHGEGAAAAAPGGLGGFPGRAPGFGPGPGPGQPGVPFSVLRIATDKRTRTLMARGPASELKALTELIAVLDIPEGQAASKTGRLRVFKLKHADPRSVIDVVARLGLATFPSRLAPDMQGKALIVVADPDVMRDVAEIVQVLDVEGPAQKEKLDDKD